MCNPRRVQVRATRRLAEAWDHEVRRQVTLHRQAVGRAAIREQLAGTVGRPVLACMDRVLTELDGWQETAAGYRYDLDGGYVLFNTATGELEIAAELTSDVHGEGEASTTVRAEVDEDLEAEGTGRYYDDEWGGFTQARARRVAEEDAQRALDEAAADRIAAAQELAAAGADAQLLTEAEQRAQGALNRAVAAREEQLANAAADRLAEVGVAGRAVVNRALAQGYREAILVYARSRHAEGVRMSSAGGVLSIQFEMEA